MPAIEQTKLRASGASAAADLRGNKHASRGSWFGNASNRLPPRRLSAFERGKLKGVADGLHFTMKCLGAM
jgi:hypothetical protein